MEKMGDWEKKNLVNELVTGRELARQLQIHVNVPSSSRETRELLVQKIVTSYENALSMLNLSSLMQQSGATARIMPSDSPSASLGGSPRSDQDSDRELKDQQDPNRKRKSSEKWTKQVRVNLGMGLEGPLEDGFSWRKYGQKDILGAKYPRGYYRCTHRILQGCLATKQVQRSDEDPTIFDITYRGRHSCTGQMFHQSSQPLDQNQEITNPSMEPRQQETQPLSQDLLLNFRSDLKVITEGFDHHQEQSILPFNFTPENQAFSPSFMSSAPENTNYFSASSSGVVHQSYGGQNQRLQATESELSDMIAANSPNAGVEFPFGNVEFDPKYFSFDNINGFIS
ncbi:probable WRKY transcription factor 53 [Mercurialis annua]|uniref:probable WRKY transcription factor 53 n=1 Tax=Mercurialis annua TaxID=3986 RepID=UPI0021610088|nr:probable WRKY transcription factor 53 [Mercurialis annua]